jgi:hypothetical protein
MNIQLPSNSPPNTRTLILSEIQKVKGEVEATLKPLDNPTQEQELARQAWIDHQTLLRLGDKERVTNAAKRWQLWEAYRTEFFTQVRLPRITPANEEIPGEYETFSTFEGYFKYLCNQWGITAPATVSTMLNGTIYLLPAAESGIVKDNESGEIYRPEDILVLEESVQQMLIGVANRVLNPAAHRGKPQDVSTIGQAVSIAHGSTTVSEVATRLQQAGLMGKNDEPQCTAEVFNSGNDVYVGLVMNQVQYKSFLLRESRFIQTRSALSRGDVATHIDPALANTLQETDDDNFDSREDDSASLTGYLTSLATR